MLTQKTEVIVVGLGAMGSATAYQLAKNGIRVIGIDQYTPPHDLGSSHGDSRITRQAVGEGASYVPFVLRSNEIWRELEAETGTEVLRQCGTLMMRPSDVKAAQHGVEDRFAATVQVAEQFGIPHEVLDASEVRHRYSELVVGDNVRAYFEPGGGFVRPEAAVSGQLLLAQRNGADLRFGERVTSVAKDGDCVIVTTDKNTYSADRVVISAGPWIGRFFSDPDLAKLFRVYRQVLHWFPVDPAAAPVFAPDRFPVFIWTFGQHRSDYMYGFPMIDGPSGGMKVATERYEAHTDPGSMDREVGPDEAQQMYDHCVKGRVPAVGRSAIRSVACLYTVTPDYGFILDESPEMSGVFIVSPCSGHGFKHSAAVGEAVAQRVNGEESAIDVSLFSFARFGASAR